MNKMEKKGELGWGTLATVAMVFLVVVVSYFMFRPASSEVANLFSSETLKARDSKCLLDGQRAQERGQQIEDIDKDSRPDNCDICVCAHESCKNEKDNDFDGMPNGCDKNENDRSIVACRGTRTNDGRCLVDLVS